MFLRFLLLGVLLLNAYSQAFAQIPARYVEPPLEKKMKSIKDKAKLLFETGKFEEAYVYYVKLNALKPRNKKYQLRLADLAMKARNYNLTVQLMKPFMEKKSTTPELRYLYADALKHSENYTEALIQFEKIAKQRNHKDDDFGKRITRQLIAVSDALMKMEAREILSASKSNLKFNSAADERSQVVIGKDSLLYMVEDKEGSRLTKFLGNVPTNLTGMHGNPALFTGNPVLGLDKKTVYYTRMEGDPDGIRRSRIYMAELTPEGNLANPKKLGKNVNVAGTNNTTPCVAVSANGQEILYFASDRPGGAGGYDLWFSVRMVNGEYTNAWHMGYQINSDYDEFAPYFLESNKTLYYASNRIDGFGGYDVYRTTGEKKYWNRPILLGFPINSGADDYFLRMESPQKGYISSNRRGSLYDAYEFCCDDIFVIGINRGGN